MLNRSNLLHLRIPFSLFLSPVYFMALMLVPQIDLAVLTLSFVSIHLFLYPASQAYNSYYDRDENSIGGLETPPEVQPSLLKLSYIFDAVALLLALFVNINFFVAIAALSVISKLYSHPTPRLKKRPLLGWFTVALFQGAGVFLTVLFAFIPLTQIQIWPHMAMALIASLFFGGAYPLTQVYQHHEDAKRGDLTLSRLLGVKGTFVFSMVVTTLGGAGLFYYFFSQGHLNAMVALGICLVLPVGYLNIWALRSFKDSRWANYRNTMRMNKISALSMLVFWGYLLWST